MSVGSTVELLKQQYTGDHNLPMLKIVEAMTVRRWHLLCEYWISCMSLVIRLEANPLIGCRVRYWHPFDFGRSRFTHLPPVEDMVDSYLLSWSFMDRHKSYEGGLKDNERGLTFKEVMERLDDLFANNGKEFFENQGDRYTAEEMEMLKSDSNK